MLKAFYRYNFITIIFDKIIIEILIYTKELEITEKISLKKLLSKCQRIVKDS